MVRGVSAELVVPFLSRFHLGWPPPRQAKPWQRNLWSILGANILASTYKSINQNKLTFVVLPRACALFATELEPHFGGNRVGLRVSVGLSAVCLLRGLAQ
jgi:hypothetical protein